MATIENFLLKFKVEGQTALDNANSSVKNLGTQVTGLTGGLSGLAGGLAIAGTAFAALGMKAIALADEISDISDATGVSAGALLNFKQSLIEAGGKADDFATLASKLNQNIGEAADGSDKAQKAFRNLGVFVTDAGGKVRSTEVILQDAIARLAAIEDPSKRAAAAIDLFGKNAAKLDFTKLTAIQDPVKDADIKRLADYQAAIDKVRNRLETQVISFFGSVAQDIDTAYEKADKIEKKLEEMGQKSYLGPGLRAFLSAMLGMEPRTPLITKEMSQQEKTIKEMTDQMPSELKRLQGRTQPSSGGKGTFGPEPESMRKRRMEIEATSAAYKLQNNLLIDNINFEKAMVGKTDEYVQVEKAREEVIKRAAAESAKLQDAKKALGKDEQALAAVYDQQIAKIQAAAQVDADRVANATQGLINLKMLENARKQDIENTTKAIEAQINRQQLLGASLRGINEQRIDLNFQRGLQGLSEYQKQIKVIQEEGRKAALALQQNFAESFGDTTDPLGMTPEQMTELQKGIDDIAASQRRLTNDRLADLDVSRAWLTGWQDAYTKYYEDATNASKIAKDSFASLTGNLENALVRLATTGKLSFKDLANSIIGDLARIYAKQMVVGLFGKMGENGTSSGGILSGLVNSFTGLFKAEGGPVSANRPYIIGEKGAELFIPRSSGNIIPNNKLAMGGGNQPSVTNVNYNIQAVDAASFRSLVARDPSFIYAVTEQGRRSQPTRR